MYTRSNGRDNTRNFICGDKTDVNQQKHTKNLKLKFYEKSCQYEDNWNNNYFFSDTKDEK